MQDWIIGSEGFRIRRLGREGERPSQPQQSAG